MAFKLPSPSRTLNRIGGTAALGVPVGNAALLVPFMGIFDGVNSAVGAAVGDKSKVDIGPVSIDFLPAALGLATAVALVRVKGIRKFLGNEATKAAAIAAMAVGLNRATHLSGWTRYGVARLAGFAGHSKPWEIIGVDATQWQALTNPASENYDIRHSVARKAADLAGAPVQFALRPGMAAPAFESVPQLAGFGYAGAISSIDQNQQSIRIPRVATP